MEERTHAIVDGGHGLGQIVATRALEIAIQKAGESGVGAVWAWNTNDIGMVANYPMQALAQAPTTVICRPWPRRHGPH